MCIYNRIIPSVIETPERMPTPAPLTAEKPHSVVRKYKIITPTVNYYIWADRVIYGDIYLDFFLDNLQVACISLNTVYGVLMIDSRAASSEAYK